MGTAGREVGRGESELLYAERGFNYPVEPEMHYIDINQNSGGG